VRTQTRSLIAVATLGVLAASYQFGTSAQTGLLLGMPSATANTSGSPEPTAAASGSAVPSATATATAGATSSAAAPAAPTVTKTPTTAPTKAPVAAAKTATGAAIDYKYGTVQLKVTQSSGKLTDVNVLVGFGSGPQYTDLIASLAQYAITANGSDFGNVSRATFTTTAFKQALDSAIAKL
jgi:uncharacterized protein with FMN-binding domain